MTLRAQDLAQRLQQRLQPQVLEVLDESAAHAGHVGANESGQGTHFPGPDWRPGFQRAVTGGPPPACV